MNLESMARTDRVLDEIGGRRGYSAADDEILAALASWVEQIDDVPVANRRGRHRAARGGRLHRIVGGGAVVLATFSGASVAAALSGAEVPGMTGFGRAVVALVPGDQFPGQPLDDVWGAGAGRSVDAVPASVVAGDGASGGEARPDGPGPRTRATVPGSPHGPERVLPGQTWIGQGPDDQAADDRTDPGAPGDGTTATPPGQDGEQTDPPEHARNDVVPGQEKKDQIPPGQDGEQTDPPEHARNDVVPGQEKKDQVPPGQGAQQTDPPEHARNDQVPGQEKKDQKVADPVTEDAGGEASASPSGLVPVAVAPSEPAPVTPSEVAPPANPGTTPAP